MQIKISEEKQNAILKNIKYIALLVGVLSVVIAYFLVYSKVTVANEELNTEISELEVRLDDLRQKKKNQKKYEEGIKTFSEDTAEILSGFDAGLSPERIIVDYQDMSDSLEVTVTSVKFSEPENVYTFGSSGTSAKDDGTATTGLTGYCKNMNVSVTGTYATIKDFLTMLMETTGRRRVPTSVSFTFDSTINSVTCTANVTEYAVIGGDRTESVPIISEYATGVDNIFFSGGVGTVVQ